MSFQNLKTFIFVGGGEIKVFFFKLIAWNWSKSLYGGWVEVGGWVVCKANLVFCLGKKFETGLYDFDQAEQ